MRTPRKTQDAGTTAPPQAARGRRAHAGPPADEPPEHAPEAPPGATERPRPSVPSAPSAPSAPLGRRGLRPRTVRAKIVSLLMVPVVSLLALWGFATVTTAQDIARLRQLQRVDADIREPVAAAVAALQAERRAAVRQVSSPGTGRAAELKDQTRRTDAAVARLRLDDEHTIGDRGDLPREVADRIGRFVESAEGLGRLRTAAANGGADWDEVYTQYTATITAAFAVGGALTGIQDAEIGADARVLLEFGRAGEMLAREDALLGSAHLGGELSTERLRQFTGAVETRRALVESATADLRGPERAAWQELADQRGYQQLTTAEDRIGAAAPGKKALQAVPAATWDDAMAVVRNGLTNIETDARRAAADRADPFGGGVFTAGGAAVLLGLAAVAASLVISVRIGRALVIELISLRNTALGIARRKLPAAMLRLRAGEEIDVRAEAPPGPAPQDEIGQVGEALTTVHRAALSAAVERAELASGISGVFVNLARRSQVLVHRQLNLLDSMERRADDPGELGDLFRLDHLTTRMRRHAESLIILSGAAPGRAWRMPVPLTNVVRAAVSEIEDYARVEMRQLPETSVIGGAVADLTHLLAELIENAAQFSPPHTKVRISGEPVGNGYALEIEDRGLGMGKETLAEANTRIAQSEALDLFDSDRLGLFVVSRLSSRHDIKVHLRTSPYGGTTAVVLLPTDVLQGALPPGRSAAHGRTSEATRGDGPQGHAPHRERPGAEEAPYPRHRAQQSGPMASVPSQSPAPSLPPSRSHSPASSHSPSQASPHSQSTSPSPTGPQSLPRPPRIPALAGQPEPPDHGPASPEQPPAGVTTLRRRGQSATPPQAPSAAPAPTGSGPTDSAPTDSAPTGSGPAGAPGDDSGDLPRRVRQASLVPQLREAPPADLPPTPAVQGAEERTPEQVRDRMTAYRDGWARGGGAAPGTRRPLGTGSGRDFGNDPDHGRDFGRDFGSEGDHA
ncbi:nitrate- and nitrite sensing domain-containing protein [Streptomyces sp. Je 1-79]|uniref:sensor histidine kinase n=1 Tax=Streptomyces sp. Je 1-79 TaxID=2943847 RepID=UPI0021A88868|nr:nitrate- and nitrite sensing domain-containing protein [Streptomyces sp. Je 1-79]MCT4351899.1 nitrate- and nitrite sensing domain-containing protein [Streptomyces sp. Je 1-79]